MHTTTASGRRVRRMAAALAVAAGLATGMASLAPAAGEEQKCQLVRFFAWPMTINAAGLMTVPVPINGQPQNMLLDTGAFYSVLLQSTASRLNLKVSGGPGGIIMFGGQQSNLRATANEVMIGPVALRDRPFFVLDRDTPLFDGLLGAEILQVFDLDFDFAAGKLSVFSQSHCPGKVTYWTHGQPAAVVDFKLVGNHITFDATLGDTPVKILLDTGASVSTISLEAAARILHMDEDKLRKLREEGKANTLFPTLTLEGVTVKNPDIRLFSLDESSFSEGRFNTPTLILGMGILRQTHMYIAYKERKIYFTPAVMPAQPAAPTAPPAPATH